MYLEFTIINQQLSQHALDAKDGNNIANGGYVEKNRLRISLNF